MVRKMWVSGVRVAGTRAVQVVLLAGLIAVVSKAVGVSANQPMDEAAKAKHRIDVAGRQRMLTQRMSKAVCLALPGRDAARWSEEAFLAATTFESVLSALLNGAEDGSILPATDPEEIAALQEVEALSDGFTASVKQIASRDLHTAAMQLVLSRNQQVLQRMNAAVSEIERVSGNRTIDPMVAATISQAGRQRMLTQKMAKELCLIAGKLDLLVSRENLAQSMALFEITMRLLINGNPERDLWTAPTIEIASKLSEVQARWERIKPRLLNVLAGGKITEATLLEVVKETDVLLIEMDDAVALWVDHSD